MARLSNAVREEVLNNTRQQLLAAAAAEFTQEGYAGANINRISLAAGFAKGTIYNYFSSKWELMLALIDDIAARHVAFILQQAEPETDPGQCLLRFFSAGFAFVEQHPTLAPVVINAVYGPNKEFKERVYQAYAPLFSLLIEGIIGAGVAQGHFRSVDPNITAALVMTIYLGGSSLFKPDGTVFLDPEQVVSFILNGIRQQNANP